MADLALEAIEAVEQAAARAPILSGKALDDLLDTLKLEPNTTGKLSPLQKLVQRMIGDMKYFERGSMPQITRMVHRLSCVMSSTPPCALQACRSVLAFAYSSWAPLIYNRAPSTREPASNGKVTRALSDGAPSELEISCDASMEPHYIYSVLITYAGASVLQQCKKAGIAVSSTLDLESVATVKGSELGIYAQIVLNALGATAQLPSTILTDNYSNQRISQEARSAANSRYFLVRYTCLHHRITDGKFIVSHVPDEEMPADAFTKALSPAKTAASTAYALGQPIDYQPKPRRKPAQDANIAEQRSPLLDTVEQAIDDALIAYDGPYTAELDAALCSRLDEASLDAAVTDAAVERDVMPRHALNALVVALKVKHPQHTRQQIHRQILDSGGNC